MPSSWAWRRCFSCSTFIVSFRCLLVFGGEFQPVFEFRDGPRDRAAAHALKPRSLHPTEITSRCRTMLAGEEVARPHQGESRIAVLILPCHSVVLVKVD